MRIALRVFISMGVLLLAGVASYVAYVLLYNPAAGAQDSDAYSTAPGVWRVPFTEREEAERIAGYTLVTPQGIPPGFQPIDISIVQLGRPGGELPKSTHQSWIWEEDEDVGIQLIQDPTGSGISGSEPARIAMRDGQRSFQPAAQPHRPYDFVDYFWREGEMAYLLTGTLAGPVTEDLLQQIADSIQGQTAE